MPTLSPILIRKYYTADEVNFTPGERSFVAWISVEVLDREGDIVLAKGIDFRQYMTNPVVVAIHDYGKWPLGQCEWLKVKTTPKWTGLYGKANVDEDEDAEVVWKKIQKRSVRSVSIGFQPPKGISVAEANRTVWKPPTAEEVRRNPGWKDARRIIRECEMVEFSICPIGMNPEALIEAVSKGLHKPEYRTPEASMLDSTPAPEPSPEATVETPPEVIEEKALPDSETEIKSREFPDKVTSNDSDMDQDEDEDEDAEDEKWPIRKGHCVKVVKGKHKGVVGKVASVHRAGLVPDVEDDVPGSKDDPAVKVRCYKAMGDGHRESDYHVGCKMAHCEKTTEFKTPSRKKGLPDPMRLPPIIGKTDAEIAAERLAEIRREFTPAMVKQIVQQEIDRKLGAV